jgi:hypothetical protein
VIGSVFFACLSATPATFAAGGDYAWGNPEATTVANAKGKVFSAGLDFSGDVELAIRSNDGKTGELLWEHRVGGYPWLEPNQITVKGNSVAVVGVVDEGTGQGLDWIVIGLDAGTGEPLWPEVIIPDPGLGVANSVVIAGNTIVTTGAQFLGDSSAPATFITRGFSLKTGEMLWEDISEEQGLSFGDKVVAMDGDKHEGPLAIAYGMIANAVNDSDKLIRAYDPGTGYIVWDETIDTGLAEGGIDAFAVDNSVAYFAFASTGPGGGTWQVEARDARTGGYLWTTVNYWPGTVNGLAASGSRVVVTVSGGMQAFDTGTGEFRWEYWPEPWILLLTPVITQGQVIVSGIDWNTSFVNVTAVDASDGDFAWSNADVFAFHPWFVAFNVGDSIAAGRGLVYIAALGQTYALEVR